MYWINDEEVQRRKEQEILKAKVGNQLSKVRSSLNEKALLKLTKQLNKAVAETRQKRETAINIDLKEKIDKQRLTLLENPHLCFQIKEKAIREGWDQKPVNRITPLIQDEWTRQDHIMLEVAEATSTYVELVREILSGDERYRSIMTEYTILNKGW